MTDSELRLRSSPTSSSWRSVLTGQEREEALSVAYDVAERASDRGCIAEALCMSGHQTHHPETVRWLPCSVAEGDAGVAVLCSYLDKCRPGSGWDRIGHGFLAAGAQMAEQTTPLQPGLYSGLSGLAFAVVSLCRHGARYQRLLAALDDEVAPRASAMAWHLRSRRGGMSVSDFDLISGASGVAAQLLLRDPHRRLPELLSSLVWMTAPMEGAPRWATPPELMGDETMRRSFPSGNLNCGAAHGIPGPLSVMSLALRAGYAVPGQAEAVRGLADWLLAHRCDDQWGINWPTAIPLPASRETPAGRQPLPARSAWCYGSPGVARALWLAGEALDDNCLRQCAVEAVAAVMRRPVAARHIDSPTFCHGVAGLLQIVLRFANDTLLPFLTEAANQLVGQLLAAYEPDRPLGYASLEPGNHPVDRAGLLDGAAGTAMVLLAAATDVEPTWDRLFLLS